MAWITIVSPSPHYPTSATRTAPVGARAALGVPQGRGGELGTGGAGRGAGPSGRWALLAVAADHLSILGTGRIRPLREVRLVHNHVCLAGHVPFTP